MSTIQLRDVNTGNLLKSRQISDDAGIHQKEQLAEKMADTLEHHNDFMYAVEVVEGVAKHKMEDWRVAMKVVGIFVNEEMNTVYFKMDREDTFIGFNYADHHEIETHLNSVIESDGEGYFTSTLEGVESDGKLSEAYEDITNTMTF